MPLSALGGFAQGVSQGLQNIATLRKIQRSQEEEARALRGEKRQGELDKLRFEEADQQKTSFGQKQEEYKRLHDRTIDPESVIEGLGLDDEGKNYVRKAAKPFIPAGGKVSLADLMVIKENVLKDKNVASEITNHQLRALGTQATALKDEISTLGSESGGLGQVAAYNQKKAELEQVTARMNRLDPNWDKREDNARKEKELGLREREVSVKEKGDHTVSNLPAMRDKLEKMPEGLQKESYRRQIKEQETFELKEKAASRAERSKEFAPSDTEKKFNFWKSLYPDLSNEEIQKKVVKEDIPSEARYVLDSVKEARKGMNSPEEIKVAEKEAREMYRKITGTQPKTDTGMSPQEKKGYATQAQVKLQGATDPAVQQTLRRQVAADILKMAGGDKDNARKLAKEMGLSDSLGIK